MKPLILTEITKVYIIESLPTGHTGRMLSEDAGIDYLVEGLDDFFSYNYVDDKGGFIDVLEHCSKTALEGEKFAIHIECHGDETGLGLARDDVDWEELYPFFEKINAASSNNLLLSVAACHGLYCFKIYRWARTAPFCCLIGPKFEIQERELFAEYLEFYRRLLKDGFETAIRHLTRQEDDKFGCMITSGEVHSTLKSEYRKLCSEGSSTGIAENLIEREIAYREAQGLHELSRSALQKAENNSRQIIFNSFKSAYERYMLIDKDPRIAERFPFTPELIFS